MKKYSAVIWLVVVIAVLYFLRDREPLAGWLHKIGFWHSQQASEIPEMEHAEVSSPAGTSTTVLTKTFAISRTVEFPFQLPPHAASPQLRGTYQSYAGSGNISDENADVELLVLNQSQYDDFHQGKPGDVIFSADASHDQNVDFRLPATMEDPVKYYLIFRSAPGGDKRKVVKADFHVDF